MGVLLPKVRLVENLGTEGKNNVVRRVGRARCGADTLLADLVHPVHIIEVATVRGRVVGEFPPGMIRLHSHLVSLASQPHPC